MSLPAVAGNTLLAADLYQLCQPSGGQEKGKYFLEGNFYVSGAYCTCFIPSLSRGSTPISLSIDTADNAPTSHLNAPSNDHLTASGFHIYSTSTAISANEYCGGNYTISY